MISVRCQRQMRAPDQGSRGQVAIDRRQMSTAARFETRERMSTGHTDQPT
jgi:hypothetical protein